jgi:hypothetical protein
MMLTSLPFSRLIDAPASRVWQLITDTHRWPDWGPSVKAVECSQRFITAGVVGRIQTAVGIWLPFAIAAYEPKSYWDWRVGGLLATGHRVESMGSKRCKLTFTVPVWAFAYGLVCQLALMRIDQLLMNEEIQ